MLGLTLAIQVLVAAAGDCFFVSNTRIVLVPSCDFRPAAMAELRADTEEPEPARPQTFEAQRRSATALRWMRASARDARPFLDVRQYRELQRRLEIAERQQRIAEEQRRLSERERNIAERRRRAAERERSLALEQRDAALKELAVVRQELAAARTYIDKDRRHGAP
jgi:DNA repair exonuclease SbcCD ATPase subunit